jgi:iron complex outermembrane receptor protein
LRFDVSEAFTEVSVPLLREQPFADVLSVDAAFRVSDYSTTGSATTWKTGLIWSPIRDITVRGTIAEATRAPNVSELFDPGGQTFQDIADPCDATRLDQGSSTRAANCAALLASLGVDMSEPNQDPNTAFVGGTLRGNRDLKEEVAKTKTFGIVLRPSFAPTLSFAIDWYDIELTDAINTALPEEAAAICVDSPTGRVDLASGLSVFAGINNFTDQAPDIGADAYPVLPLGRYLYAGLTFKGF